MLTILLGWPRAGPLCISPLSVFRSPSLAFRRHCFLTTLTHLPGRLCLGLHLLCAYFLSPRLWTMLIFLGVSGQWFNPSSRHHAQGTIPVAGRKARSFSLSAFHKAFQFVSQLSWFIANTLSCASQSLWMGYSCCKTMVGILRILSTTLWGHGCQPLQNQTTLFGIACFWTHPALAEFS